MQCQYCDSHITPYPENGLCPNCGAVLPPDPTPGWKRVSPEPPAPSRPPVFVPQPGLHCCGRCGSLSITCKKQGFGWAAGLVGFILLPPFGLLFGLIGRNTLKYRCVACGHKWTKP